jgi:small subunit ribosomal protein S9
MPESKSSKAVYLGTGRRKTAVARVRVTEGTGQITINGRSLTDYFTEEKDRQAVTGPLRLLEMQNRLNVTVNVSGGGFTGQAGAICQGVARALKNMFSPPADAAANADGQPASETDPIGFVKKLRDSGYLTRDGRMKERKKYGRKGARRSFQFSKR